MSEAEPSGVVERVARAICDAGPHDPDEKSVVGWPMWKHSVPAALAAIEAYEAALAEEAK